MNQMNWWMGERPWNVAHRLGQLQNEFNRACGMYLGGSGLPFPPVNIWVKEDDVIVEAEIPGVAQKDIEIAVVGESLTIGGERKKDGKSADDAVYHRCERRSGAFSRAIELPFRVQQDKVSATCKNGVLRIVLPRSAEDKPRKIQVVAE